jgi:glutaredoxin 3
MVITKTLNLQIALFVIMILKATNLGQYSMTSKNIFEQKSSQRDDLSIIIYTKGYCPYCVKAKLLLEKKDLDYTEINVESNDTALQEMLSKSGGKKTVPQIFINDKHIGGCDDLYNLEENSKLDEIISLKIVK